MRLRDIKMGKALVHIDAQRFSLSPKKSIHQIQYESAELSPKKAIMPSYQEKFNLEHFEVIGDVKVSRNKNMSAFESD